MSDHVNGLAFYDSYWLMLPTVRLFIVWMIPLTVVCTLQTGLFIGFGRIRPRQVPHSAVWLPQDSLLISKAFREDLRESL